MVTQPDMIDIFRFMDLRAPYLPRAKGLRQNYVRDDFIKIRAIDPPIYDIDRVDTDLQSPNAGSSIGYLVYNMVLCETDVTFDDLISEILQGMDARYVLPCATGKGAQDNDLSITELEHQAHIEFQGKYYLLPVRLEQIEGLNLGQQILLAQEIMEHARDNFDLSKLTRDLQLVFGQPLREVVFQNGVYSNDFSAAKRKLFDTMYLLYILRRRVPVNLEAIIEGLRVLHVLEALATDEFLQLITFSPLSWLERILRVLLALLRRSVPPLPPLKPSDQALRITLEALYPELRGWNGRNPLPNLPLIQKEADFKAYFTATPVIHPMFARLFKYLKPFNDIKPIGVGDFKVVKQWLVSYEPGEIAHVENVLKSEVRDRTHRRLERTEETFSFSSETVSETQKDSQSTERFELKQEIENIVKTELNVGAQASFTYSGMGITSNISGNFGYRQDSTKQDKTNQEYAREIVSKAMERVQTKTAEQRSVTKVFETEEINKHAFDNSKGSGHITGIYRWLNKKYKAQLFNYGRRKMFEFIIPEPAAFFVESRLRHFEATVEVPQPPSKYAEEAIQWPTISTPNGPEVVDAPEKIKTPEVFHTLGKVYDLTEFTYPQEIKYVEFVRPENKEAFRQESLPDNRYLAFSYDCRLNSKGYELTDLYLTGIMRFWKTASEENVTAEPAQDNKLFVSVDGHDYVQELSSTNLINNQKEYFGFNREHFQKWNQSIPFVLENDSVVLTIGFLDIAHFGLGVHGSLRIAPETKHDWQTKVFSKILSIERAKADRINQERQLEYETAMATYRNRIAELKAQAVSELLQGQSEAFNREIVRTELKKHCLHLLTKDADIGGYMETVTTRPIDYSYSRFQVDEDLDAPSTSAAFKTITEEKIQIPFIDLDIAKDKAHFLQFLEQAFEWHNMSYIFYPYFWARTHKWIDMMNRLDDSDPNMTTFLQAGSVKVLLAVTPAYEDAIDHYLETGEPWEGGSAPVIGDPLYIPLHEELRKQQDERYGTTPEGEPWTFTLPTSLIYLDGAGATLPTFPDLDTD